MRLLNKNQQEEILNLIKEASNNIQKVKSNLDKNIGKDPLVSRRAKTLVEKLEQLKELVSALETREDKLEDIIHVLTPTTDNPFLRQVHRGNKDITKAPYYQILTKEFKVVDDSTPADDAKHFARNCAWHLIKKTKELNRDIEFVCLNNKEGVVGDDYTAPMLCGIPGHIKTNVIDAEGAELTIDMIVELASKVAASDGNPSILMVPPAQVSSIRGLNGITADCTEQGKNMIVSNMHIIETYYGILRVAFNRFQPNTSIYLLDYDTWEVVSDGGLVVNSSEPTISKETIDGKTVDVKRYELKSKIGLICADETKNGAIHNLKVKQ